MHLPPASLLLLYISLILTQRQLVTRAAISKFSGCNSTDLCHDANRTAESLLSPSEMDRTTFKDAQCFCDSDCWKYGDCCRDADQAIRQQQQQQRTTNWKCDLLPGSSNHEHIYVVGHCPPKWKDRFEVALCERRVLDDHYSYLLDIPVFSNRTLTAYANMYCAKCHQDHFLSPMLVELQCPVWSPNCTDLVRNATYIPGRHKWELPNNNSWQVIEIVVKKFKDWEQLHNMYRPRRCQTMVNQCATDGRLQFAQNCSAFASYVHIENYGVPITYQNVYCALCNRVNVSFVKCFPGTSQPNSFYKHTGFQIDTSSVPYSLLIDFHDLSGTNEVGRRLRCNQGDILDPIYEICVPFVCGKHFGKVGGECVSTEPNNTFPNTCRMLLVKKSEVTILDNSTIYLNKTKHTYGPGEFEENDNLSFLICHLDSDLYILKFSAVQSRLSKASMTISLSCLAAHIVIHASIAKLRNLPGKNLLNLSIALFLAQIFFIFGVNSTVYPELCITIAVVTHFCFLASFFWMNVMALDIYRTFTSANYRPSAGNHNKTFCRYAAYAWLLPATIVTVALVIDQVGIIPEVRPSYGKHICWLSHRRGLLVFFALPLAVLLLENTVFFILTAYGIHKTTKMARVVAKKSSDRIRFYLYVKLAFIMGLTWTLGFVAAIVDLEPLWYVFIVLNASQGAFIFIAFTLKRKVLRLLFECVTGKAPEAFTQSRKSSSSRRTSSSTKTSSLRDFPMPSNETLVKEQPQ